MRAGINRGNILYAILAHIYIHSNNEEKMPINFLFFPENSNILDKKIREICGRRPQKVVLVEFQISALKKPNATRNFTPKKGHFRSKHQIGATESFPNFFETKLVIFSTFRKTANFDDNRTFHR